MNYQDKYLKYKSKYNELKKKDEIYNLIGGKIPFNSRDIDDVFKFIKENMGDVNNVTEKKYFVILYGPPASGKTLSRKIACNIIKQQFREKSTYQEIMNSFVDTSVDDIVYNIKDKDNDNDKTIKEILIENLKKVFEGKLPKNKTNDVFNMSEGLSEEEKQEILKNEDVKENFNRTIERNKNKYFEYRPIADDLSLILGAFGVLRNNISETLQI